MNHLKKICLPALLLIFISCQKEQYLAVKGKGDIASEKQSLNGFDAIRLSCSAELEYTQDSLYLVEVSAQPNILKVIKMEVVEKELRIDFTKSVLEHKGVKITVHSPQMRSLSVSGSGNITATGNISSVNMNMNVSGSGNLSLPGLTAETLTAWISGSGNAEVMSGEINSSNYSISGSGNINTEFMKAAHNTSKVSGSGNVRLNVSTDLKVSISGSGDLYYRGSPAMDVDISGSGKIHKI
jgi:hypothetical protein